MIPHSEATRFDGDFETHFVSFGASHVLDIFECAKADVQDRVTRERSLKRQTATKGNAVRMFCTDELYDKNMEILKVGISFVELLYFLVSWLFIY